MPVRTFGRTGVFFCVTHHDNVIGESPVGRRGNIPVRQEAIASRRLSRAHTLVEPHTIAGQIGKECVPAYARDL